MSFLTSHHTPPTLFTPSPRLNSLLILSLHNVHRPNVRSKATSMQSLFSLHSMHILLLARPMPAYLSFLVASLAFAPVYCVRVFFVVCLFFPHQAFACVVFSFSPPRFGSHIMFDTAVPVHHPVELSPYSGASPATSVSSSIHALPVHRWIRISVPPQSHAHGRSHVSRPLCCLHS